MLSVLSELKAYRFRILAVFLFCVLLISTWLTFHSPPRYSQQVHTSLRTQLEQIIKESLLKKLPPAHNIQFQRVWTGAGEKHNTITADFQYSYETQDTLVQVSGTALIVKQPLSTGEEHEVWVVRSIQTDDTTMDFKEPIVLLAGPQQETSSPSVQNPPTEEPTEAKAAEEPSETKPAKEENSPPAEDNAKPSQPSSPSAEDNNKPL